MTKINPFKKKVSSNKRKERIKELIENIGLGNISKTELAKDFNCTRKTVREDITRVILEGLDKNVLARAKINIHSSLEAVIKKMRSLMIKGKDRDKISAASVLLNASKEQTDFLERFGEKEKTAEVIDTNITVKWQDEGEKMAEDEKPKEEKKEETTETEKTEAETTETTEEKKEDSTEKTEE